MELLGELRTALEVYQRDASAFSWFQEAARTYLEFERKHMQGEERFRALFRRMIDLAPAPVGFGAKEPDGR